MGCTTCRSSPSDVIASWLCEQRLSSLDLDGVAEYITSGRCRRIIWMSGAGISVSAGVPDFRSPNTGLYPKLKRLGLQRPESAFELDYFCQNPDPFYAVARELWPGKHRPTLTHLFVRLLHERGLLLRTWTQNIDELERIAGVPSEAIVAVHGSFQTASCAHCGRPADSNFVRGQIMKRLRPVCSFCEGSLKPDIVFYGEEIPQRIRKRFGDFDKCDLLIIAGTSLQVQPFASLVDRVPLATPRLLINLHQAGVKGNWADGGGFRFGVPGNYRDVMYTGKCDKGVETLARLMGCESELQNLWRQRSTATGKAAPARAAGGLRHNRSQRRISETGKRVSPSSRRKR